MISCRVEWRQHGHRFHRLYLRNVTVGSFRPQVSTRFDDPFRWPFRWLFSFFCDMKYCVKRFLRFDFWYSCEGSPSRAIVQYRGKTVFPLSSIPTDWINRTKQDVYAPGPHDDILYVYGARRPRHGGAHVYTFSFQRSTFTGSASTLKFNVQLLLLSQDTSGHRDRVRLASSSFHHVSSISSSTHASLIPQFMVD